MATEAGIRQERRQDGTSFFDQPVHGWPKRRVIASCTAARGPLLTRYYLLTSELGTSLRAAGWRVVHETKERPEGWNMPSRPRRVKAPTSAKRLWEATA